MTHVSPQSHSQKSGMLREVVGGLIGSIRAVLAGIFILFEPLVTGVCATLGTLGLLTAGLFAAGLPTMPSAHLHVLIGVSLGFFAAIFVYIGLIALLQRGE